MNENKAFLGVERPKTSADLILSAQAASGYKLEVIEGKETLVSPDGRKILPEQITSDQDPRLSSFCEATVRVYGKEDSTELDWLQESFAPGRPDRYFCAQVPGREEGVYVHAEFLPVGEKIAVYFCFALPDKDCPETVAMQSHAYQQAVKEFPDKALVAVTEASGEMEPQSNAAGMFRVYWRRQDGALVEIRFFAPEEAFNEKTGEPRFGRVAQHLMYGNGQKTVSSREILDVAGAMCEQFYINDKFDSSVARAKAVNGVKRLLTSLEKEVGDQELILLSAKEREKLVADGTPVINWEEGD